MKAGSTLPALLAALAAGCAMFSPKSPPPLVPPRLATSIAHYAGSSLSGPLATDVARGVDADPSRAIVCTYRIVYLERFDGAWLTPLSERSRLVVTSTGGDPFQATSQLAPRAHVGHAGAAREFLLALDDPSKLRSAEVATQVGVLPRGVTVVFSSAAAPVLLEDGRSATRAVDVEIARTEPEVGALRVALVLEGPIAAGAGDEPPDGASPAATPVRLAARESILLEDAPQIDGEPLVLLFPSTLSEGGAFAAVITTTSAPEDEAAAALHRARVEETLANIGVVGQSARERAREISRREAWSSQVASVRSALENPERRRAALVFLATSTGATLVEDAAYSSSAGELAAFAQIASDVTRTESAIDLGLDTVGHERELGWTLEKRFYMRCAQLVSEEKLPLELAGVLLRHAGECGRWADTIEDGVRVAKNAAELEAHFVRENRIFLEDTAPSARVRAFDWLAARGLAPQGFDPLGSAQDRRRVILALEVEAEAAAQRATEGVLK